MNDNLKSICAYLSEFAHHEILWLERKIDKHNKELAYLSKKKEVYRQFFIRIENILKGNDTNGKNESNSNNTQK